MKKVKLDPQEQLQKEQEQIERIKENTSILNKAMIAHVRGHHKYHSEELLLTKNTYELLSMCHPNYRNYYESKMLFL